MYRKIGHNEPDSLTTAPHVDMRRPLSAKVACASDRSCQLHFRCQRPSRRRLQGDGELAARRMQEHLEHGKQFLLSPRRPAANLVVSQRQ